MGEASTGDTHRADPAGAGKSCLLLLSTQCLPEWFRASSVNAAQRRHPTGGSAEAVSEQTQEGPACTEGPLLLSLPRKTTHPAVTDNLKDGRIRKDAALI